ncbi:MAG: T9SS type A sorting domain-containing protein [Candidatus Latescibacteria bacterium]|nr:T9SS type A sorting domain-containing protein [Candidatus Latescibacterota bacterium]
MTRLLLTLAVLAVMFPASTFAQCPELEPLDDGSGAFGAIGLPALVISEVNPGQYVELFNTTGADIVLPNIYFLCSHFVYAQVAGTVPAGGYATVIWPANFLTANDTNGEMMLYDSGSFGTSTDILDYIIWGNPAATRRAQAVAVGKWVGAANAPSITGGAIHRRIGVKGNQASEYDAAAAPTPEDCVPDPGTGVGDTPALTGARIWNSPNPFKASTNVDFVLDAPASVEVAVYAIDGSLVKVLAAQSYPAGRHRATWDGTDQNGRTVASGTYLARVSGNGVNASARLTVIR